MRKFLGQPKNIEVFNNEAPFANRIRKFMRFCMAVSAMTTTAAYNIFSDQLLDRFSSPVRGLILVAAFSFLALPIERFIQSSAAHLARVRLANDAKVSTTFSFRLTGFLLAVLIAYSFVFSFVSTRSAIKVGAGEVPELDLSIEDSKLASAKDQNMEAYQIDLKSINDRFDDLIESEKAKHTGAINSLLAEIAYMEQKAIETGTSFRTSIRNARKKIAAVETKRDESVSSLENQRSGEISVIQGRRQNLDQIATVERNDNVETLRQRNDKAYNGNEILTSSFSWILSVLAAMCVLFVVLCTFFIESFIHRAGLPVKIMKSNDFFQESVLSQTLNLPATVVKRYLSLVNSWTLGKLPSMPEPYYEKNIYDNGTAEQDVKDLSKGSSKKKNPPEKVKTETPPPDKTSYSVKKTKKVDQDLSDRINEQFRSPVTNDLFYKIIGKHPKDFAESGAYLTVLKKELKNRHASMKGVIVETVLRNKKRYEATKHELGRMCVDVIELEGRSPDTRGYLNQEEHEQKKAECLRYVANL